MDESDDEKLLNDDVNADDKSWSENDEDLDEEREQKLMAKLKKR